MREPQEIEDAEHEQVLGRVAAVDVAKASGMVCTRVPHEGRPGGRRTRVWTVDAAINAVLELAGHLVAERVEKVTLRPHRITGGSGFTCWSRRGWRCSWLTPGRSGPCRA